MLLPRLSALVALLALLAGAPLGCSPSDDDDSAAGDDDDASADDDDDDDDDTVEPVEVVGSWAGVTAGVVLISSASKHGCEGAATVVVDEDNYTSGALDCWFAVTDLTCTFEFAGVRLESGPDDTELDCWSQGDATVQSWFDGQALHGRVQMLGDPYSVEIGWLLERVGD